MGYTCPHRTSDKFLRKGLGIYSVIFIRQMLSSAKENNTYNTCTIHKNYIKWRMSFSGRIRRRSRDVRIDCCLVTGSRSTVICTMIKWSQYKVNGLLTGVKTKCEPVTRMWHIHYDGEQPHLNEQLKVVMLLIKTIMAVTGSSVIELKSKW